MNGSKILATAWWTSFFALMWGGLLEVIPRSPRVTLAEIFFFVGAVLVSALVYGSEAEEKKKK